MKEPNFGIFHCSIPDDHLCPSGFYFMVWLLGKSMGLCIVCTNTPTGRCTPQGFTVGLLRECFPHLTRASWAQAVHTHPRVSRGWTAPGVVWTPVASAWPGLETLKLGPLPRHAEQDFQAEGACWTHGGKVGESPSCLVEKPDRKMGRVLSLG